MRHDGTTGIVEVEYQGTNSYSSLLFKTANATALTLDTSQNATFAGSISIPATDKLFFDGAGNNTYIQETAGDNLVFHSGALALTLNSSQNATFTGSVGLLGTAALSIFGSYWAGTQTISDNSPYFTYVSDGGWQKTSAAFTNQAGGVRVSAKIAAGNTQNWTTSAVQLRGVESNVNIIDGSTGTLTGAASFYAKASILNGDMVLTNAYGMYLETQTAGSNNYGLYVAGGGTAAIYVASGESNFQGAVNIQGGYANGGGAPYDGVVDAGGGGNWTTAQAGDDELDAGSYTMLIKAGGYSTLTVSTDNATIVVEPGATFSGAVVLSGSNIKLVLGNESQMSGLVTLSGVANQLICENGVDLVGILVSGADCLVDGGGWGTVSNGGTARHAIQITGADVLVENIAAQTTAGGGSSMDAVRFNGARANIHRIKIIGSDNAGVISSAGGVDAVVSECTILGADNDGISLDAPRCRVVDNYIIATGVRGIHLEIDADNSTVIGNIVKDAGDDTIEIQVNNEDCVVVGNRFDGAVDDNSGTSIVANNDETAF